MYGEFALLSHILLIKPTTSTEKAQSRGSCSIVKYNTSNMLPTNLAHSTWVEREFMLGKILQIFLTIRCSPALEKKNINTNDHDFISANTGIALRLQEVISSLSFKHQQGIPRNSQVTWAINWVGSAAIENKNCFRRLTRTQPAVKVSTLNTLIVFLCFRAELTFRKQANLLYHWQSF